MFITHHAVSAHLDTKGGQNRILFEFRNKVEQARTFELKLIMSCLSVIGSGRQAHACSIISTKSVCRVTS